MKSNEYIVPTEGKQGMSRLLHAAYSGNIDELSNCLKSGMNPNDIDDGGYGALHWLMDMSATSGPRIEMLQLLLSHDADVNLQSVYGTTSLMLACSAGSHIAVELVVILLSAGADPKLRSEDSTCLHESISNPELINILISAGAPLLEKNSNGLTPLELAKLDEYTLSKQVALIISKAQVC